MQGRDSEDVWSRFVFELVIWPKEVNLVSRTQPSGPLCLWQCFILVLVLKLGNNSLKQFLFRPYLLRMVATPKAHSCQNHLESIWWFSTPPLIQTLLLQNALALQMKMLRPWKGAKAGQLPFFYQTQITNDNKNWRSGYTEYEQTQYRSLRECQHFHFDGA